MVFYILSYLIQKHHFYHHRIFFKPAGKEPDISYLDVRGWEKAFNLGDENCGHHQHGDQVHTESCFKDGVVFFWKTKSFCLQNYVLLCNVTSSVVLYSIV